MVLMCFAVACWYKSYFLDIGWRDTFVEKSVIVSMIRTPKCTCWYRDFCCFYGRTRHSALYFRLAKSSFVPTFHCSPCSMGLSQSQSTLHEPTSNDASLPVKSAMRRSRSTNANRNLLHIHNADSSDSATLATSATSSSTDHRSSCCSETSIASNGGSYANTGGCGKKGSNGYISPQWGWYVSTTPPTPEMYHNNRYKHQSSSVVANHTRGSSDKGTTEFNLRNHPSAMLTFSQGRKRHAGGSDIPLTTTLDVAKLSLHDSRMDESHRLAFQPAFSKNVKGMGNNMGWPSVPL